jgi:hypothetical protein
MKKKIFALNSGASAIIRGKMCRQRGENKRRFALFFFLSVQKNPSSLLCGRGFLLFVGN